MAIATKQRESPRDTATKVHLELVDLEMVYPGQEQAAVDRISLTLGRGHLLALLGPSGCGKTTTLRMVAGLLEPSGGRILVDGNDVTRTAVHRRGMGMVFQSYALFPHMDVAANVAFGLQMRKVRREERDRRVREALDLVQLGHLAARRVRQLSGGQQQRVAVARALVVEPRLLLLDEPLSNLDAKLREAMREEIRAIQQKTGITTVFVTHDQDEALSMADVIAVMNAGRVEQIGSPQDVYERPATRFVADFIGRANLLPGTVITSGPGTAQVAVDGLGQVDTVVPADRPGQPAGAQSPIVRGAQVTVLIRPHRIAVHPGEADIPGSRPGTVESRMYTGDLVSYTLRVEDTRLTAEALTHDPHTFPPGSAVQVAWRTDHALTLIR